MKINNVSLNKVVNLYSQNKKVESKKTEIVKKDSIEISKAARSLNGIHTGENFGNSEAKIEELRKQVSQGTYKGNASLTAKSMIDIIKEREV